MTTLGDWLKQAGTQLQPVSDSARLDAEVLLCYLLDKPRSYLFSWPEAALSKTQLDRLRTLLQRRIKGEPIAYITGEREFWSLKLHVDDSTLIPRPETELMVEQMLARLPADKPLSIVDLGTGTGAIALALAVERPQWSILATDKSEQALHMAQYNAEQLQLSNVRFAAGDWFAPLQDMRFDAIISNPPYIPDQDPHLHQGDVRFEPLSALASGPDGLGDIRQICDQAPAFLRPGGLLAIEHGYDQQPAVAEIFRNNNFQQINQINDLADKPRITLGSML